MSGATCMQRVNRGDNRHYDPRVCGKPGKGEIDGEPACGLHLAARRRRARNDRLWGQAREGSSSNFKRASKASDALAELGIKAVPHYQVGRAISGSGHDGLVIVDPAEILSRLEPSVQLPAIRPFTPDKVKG